MGLKDKSGFYRKSFHLPETVFSMLMKDQFVEIKGKPLAYIGYARLPEHVTLDCQVQEIEAEVDNFFRLSDSCGFEKQQIVLSAGIRGSRFAPIIFWEIFHALAEGGLWIDIDEANLCNGTALSKYDFLSRGYFRDSLDCLHDENHGAYRKSVYRKVAPALICQDVEDTGWTFGILTAGPSRVATQIVNDILGLHKDKIEIIICGPDPGSLPKDQRIKRIDLDHPEPRGWITRKKNLIVNAANFGNLCIMHDRFVFPQNFFCAMSEYVPVFSVITFPEFFFPDSSRSFLQRYPDYQVLIQKQNLDETFVHKIYNSQNIFHPRYDDFSETAFCCGGIYVTKRSIWQLIKQDESLYHCEWEDILFGLAAQRKGIPHRVNPFVAVESLNPPPLLQTRIHALKKNGTKQPSFSHVSNIHKKMALKHPERFKPLINRTREEYYSQIMAVFNSLEVIDESQKMSLKTVAHCKGLFDFWKEVYLRVGKLKLENREHVRGPYDLICRCIYPFPNCVVQLWIRDTELSITGPVIENDRIKQAPPPKPSLKERLLLRLRPFLKGILIRYFCRIPRPISGVNLNPFASLLLYFWEVERYHPVIFAPHAPTHVACTQERNRLIECFKKSPQATSLMFVRYNDVILPPGLDLSMELEKDQNVKRKSK